MRAAGPILSPWSRRVTHLCCTLMRSWRAAGGPEDVPRDIKPPHGQRLPAPYLNFCPQRSSAHQHLQTPTCFAPRCWPGEMEQD